MYLYAYKYSSQIKVHNRNNTCNNILKHYKLHEIILFLCI